MGLLLLIVLLGFPGLAFAQAPDSAQPPQPVRPPQPPQPDAPVFRSDVRWVRLDVQAGDRKRLLGGLTKDDFIVHDEGRPQPIDYFGHESEPLDVLLLLDVSGSMSRYLEQMAATARRALQQLHPEDRVGIMLFARRAELRDGLTADRGTVERDLRTAVRERGLGSGTLINSAVIAAAEYMRGQQPAPASQASPGPGRRAILVVTDNMGLNYQVPDDKVIESLLGADAVLNAIVVGRGERPRPPKPGQHFNPDFTPSDVFHLADETGGTAVKAQDAGESFRDMMEAIRTRYSIQYRAPESQPGSFRRVHVELSPPAHKRYPNAWVRARSGYFVTQ